MIYGLKYVIAPFCNLTVLNKGNLLNYYLKCILFKKDIKGNLLNYLKKNINS